MSGWHNKISSSTSIASFLLALFQCLFPAAAFLSAAYNWEEVYHSLAAMDCNMLSILGYYSFYCRVILALDTEDTGM